jgi:hypothetical protein
VVGDSLNVTDVPQLGKSIDWIHMRHEEAAAFAAEAEAHLTVSHAVCAGSCGRANPREALKIADNLHVGSRIVDISFDGGSGPPVYRMKNV